MILSIDLNSDVPIYQQLRDSVVAAIAAGRLRAGDPLPATRRLGTDLGVNFHTVNKAYDLLRREGLLHLNRKTGAVIARDAGSGPPATAFYPDWEARLGVLLAEAIAHGASPDEILDRAGAQLSALGGTDSAAGGADSPGAPAAERPAAAAESRLVRNGEAR